MQECNRQQLATRETVSPYNPSVVRTCQAVTTHVLVAAARSSNNVTEEIYNPMEASKQTIQQIERTLRKVIAKFPADAEPVMTDIHLLVSNYTGEIRTYNDDDEELDRCVVEEWIKSSDEKFYEDIVPILRSCIENMRPNIEKMSRGSFCS